MNLIRDIYLTIYHQLSPVYQISCRLISQQCYLWSPVPLLTNLPYDLTLSYCYWLLSEFHLPVEKLIELLGKSGNLVLLGSLVINNQSWTHQDEWILSCLKGAAQERQLLVWNHYIKHINISRKVMKTLTRYCLEAENPGMIPPEWINHPRVIELLVEYNQEIPNIHDDYYFNNLHQAARKNSLYGLQQIYRQGYLLPYNLLDIAASYGYMELTYWLLEIGQLGSYSAYRLPISKGRLNIVQWLHRFNFPYHSSLGEWAIRWNQPTIIKFFLESGFRINLETAIIHGHSNILTLLYSYNHFPLSRMLGYLTKLSKINSDAPGLIRSWAWYHLEIQ